MNILLVGINHRTALLEVRERFWLSDAEIRAVLPVFRDRFFSECGIVSTCNRTELFGIPDAERMTMPAAEAMETMVAMLAEFKGVDLPDVQRHFYHLAGSAALAHLFKVAAGLDSMVIGDIQILNQVKSHAQIAVEQRTSGTLLNRVMQTAFHAAKRARTETGIGGGAVSVSYAAVELASKIFSNLSAKTALLIGAGETGELTAQNLVARGIGSLLIANRTRSRAEELAARIGGRAADFDALQDVLPQVDIVIASVASQEYVLRPEHIRPRMHARSYQPLLIVDIGVPRNVDPAVNKFENVFVHDMDALARIVDQNVQRRRAEIPRVNEIVLEEIRGLRQWSESLQVNPAISDLRNHFEAVRAEEVRKYVQKFTADDRELLDLVTKRIVNKLLHLPTTTLKNGGAAPPDERHTMIHHVRTLFGLHARPIRREEEETDA